MANDDLLDKHLNELDEEVLTRMAGPKRDQPQTDADVEKIFAEAFQGWPDGERMAGVQYAMERRGGDSVQDAFQKVIVSCVKGILASEGITLPDA